MDYLGDLLLFGIVVGSAWCVYLVWDYLTLRAFQEDNRD